MDKTQQHLESTPERLHGKHFCSLSPEEKREVMGHLSEIIRKFSMREQMIRDGKYDDVPDYMKHKQPRYDSYRGPPPLITSLPVMEYRLTSDRRMLKENEDNLNTTFILVDDLEKKENPDSKCNCRRCRPRPFICYPCAPPCYPTYSYPSYPSYSYPYYGYPYGQYCQPYPCPVQLYRLPQYCYPYGQVQQSPTCPQPCQDFPCDDVPCRDVPCKGGAGFDGKTSVCGERGSKKARSDDSVGQAFELSDQEIKFSYGPDCKEVRRLPRSVRPTRDYCDEFSSDRGLNAKPNIVYDRSFNTPSEPRSGLILKPGKATKDVQTGQEIQIEAYPVLPYMYDLPNKSK